jgi:competence protein ComEC
MTTDQLPRSAVHASAASPRGASRPRQEAPPDFRLLPPAVAGWLAAAIALALPGTAVAWTCAAAVPLALVLFVLRHRGRGLPTAVATALLCAATAAAVAALHAADLHRGPMPRLATEHARATVELTVAADPRMARPHVRGAARAPASVVVEAEAHRLTTGATTTAVRTPVLLIARQSAGAWLRLLPSTHLTVHARIAPPTRPGDRFAAVLSVHGPPHITGPPAPAQRTAGRLRAGLREATDGLAPDARALLPGLVVGDISRITPELHHAFEATDLTHLTAVSGSNLAIILMLLIGPPATAIHAERRGLAPRLAVPLRLTAVLGGLLTLSFVAVCRPEPSVLRAAACGLITLLAIGTGRRRTLLPALAGAVLLLLLYDPWLARSYGFLLSVMATGALLTLAPSWSAALQRRGLPPRLAEVLAAAASTQAVCAPVVAVLAAQVSLVGVPCNLLAELAVAPATMLGFAATAAAPLAMPLARTLAWAGGWPAGWIAAVARRGAALPGATIDWPGTWAGALLLAAITATALLLGRRLAHNPWLCGAVALLLILAVLRPDPLPRTVTGWPPQDWRMVACDVGQGDALVLSAGPGTAVMVDTGPEPDLADRCLSGLGISTVPLLVLSHFHADHVDGLPGVLRGRTVGAIETTPLDEPPEQAAYVRRAAAAAGIPVVRAAVGERRRLGPLDWQVLWPPAAGTAFPHNGPNDASVTLLVRTAGLTMLLLGDLEPTAQRGLLDAIPDLPRVDILKVAHHGSAFQDPALLGRLRPRLAVISSGADNPYGHPSPHTVTTLRAHGATVLRTDTDGSIAVTGDAECLRASVPRPTPQPPHTHAPGTVVARARRRIGRLPPRSSQSALMSVAEPPHRGACTCHTRCRKVPVRDRRSVDRLPVSPRRHPLRRGRPGRPRAGLTYLPASVTGLTTLRRIDLDGNMISHLPPGIASLPRLNSLTLYGNRLTGLPPEIDRMAELRDLCVGHNRLTDLPSAIGGLTALSDYLYLSGNGFTSVPASLGRLDQLGYLGTADNRLTALPHSIGGMAALHELRLHDNRIEELPDTIGRLARLRELHLRNNLITALPETIGDLAELRRLDLRDNPLGSLPQSLAGLHRLTELDLRATRITDLPDSLADLPRLEKLDLRWTKLDRLPVWLDDLRHRGCLVLV